MRTRARPSLGFFYMYIYTHRQRSRRSLSLFLVPLRQGLSNILRFTGNRLYGYKDSCVGLFGDYRKTVLKSRLAIRDVGFGCVDFVMGSDMFYQQVNLSFIISELSRKYIY